MAVAQRIEAGQLVSEGRFNQLAFERQIWQALLTWGKATVVCRTGRTLVVEVVEDSIEQDIAK